MNIVLIGSGNIATVWGKAFAQLGHNITQVYSHKLANACALANLLSAEGIDELTKLNLEAELYILAVSDSAIPEIVDQLPKQIKGILIHCSGASDIAVLNKFEQYGVAYPIQSFSKDVELDFKTIPFGIEANTKQNVDFLTKLFSSLSENVFPCDSEQRLAIHLGAVIVNNFSNALFQMAYELLAQHQLPFNLLQPIILETAQKVQNRIPRDVQTGPAVRNDDVTINKHLQFISDNPEWQSIYQQITDLIKKRG
ncbi:DUF2520 domain-containing protein [Sphingobacterium sp. DK4209]|uniref:DUF2520 domain-containing protein n=1 Tax=Sphingobacterium zhuxiongii TaxID=2662364 RepID=A0A5Q0QDW9_9SPHI|nr:MULTISPECIES: Rossmann-like and DUF2520 domain-containing protein [unclassified Sphingobacterium]MVZ65392.1 DUF2520 domain-containing protein [Sphingobacterium sp. DK4209]QGA27454.1 DUF2520 domain-containing protein [Sphingobacterium sp. dk4302]